MAIAVYRYDNLGNRTMTGYTTGVGNRVLASPGFTYTYDFEGNLASKTETATGKVTTYSYDHRNRLTGVTQRASSGGAIIAQATYTYDALNRRIRTQIDADGAGPTAPVRRWTVYDGENPYADFNNNGTLQTRYLHGPAVDFLLARTAANGTTAWYLTDRLGSVRDIANTSGTVIDHIAYDAYGNITSESSPSNGDRFKFTGREFDPVTGLQYNRARYYDAAIGRWTQEDPIGFAAADANLYRYVGNGPTNYIDANGLDRLKAEAMLGHPGRWNLYVEEDTLFGTVIHSWVGVLDEDGLVTFCVNGRELKVKLGTLLRAAWDGKLRTGVAQWFEKNALDEQGEWEARHGYRAMLAREGADPAYFANSIDATGQIKWLTEQGIDHMAFGGLNASPSKAMMGLPGAMSVRRPAQIGIHRPPRHHIFPQEMRDFFAKRGFHDIDNYTIPLDRATHEAIHLWMGSGGWNDVMKARILAEEHRLGRLLNRKEIIKIGADMRKEAGLAHIKCVPYE